jgi:hypothetical protein
MLDTFTKAFRCAVDRAEAEIRKHGRSAEPVRAVCSAPSDVPCYGCMAQLATAVAYARLGDTRMAIVWLQEAAAEQEERG